MNVQCPRCWSVYRVDPGRVPPAGVRARCSRCSEVLTVERPGAAPASRPQRTGAPGAAAAHRGGGTAMPPAVLPQPIAPPAAAAPAAPAAAPPGAGPARERPGRAGAGPAETPAPAASGVSPRTGAGGVSRAGGRASASDPDERARRIARALISDIVVYHKERCERSLQTGTLRTEFKEEILKSWDEYVEQVGLEMARATPHFRDALNEILAKGQKVF